jgi:hypothetical protein
MHAHVLKQLGLLLTAYDSKLPTVLVSQLSK